jgi:carboxyl-terminal processing protease
MEKDNGLSSLIIDLRGNPGGLLSSAVDISDRFVGEGTIVSTVNSANKETKRYEAKAEHSYRRFPIIILVNQGSASASEIVSGAIQDYQRGLIVGNRSFGKGSVQDLFPMDRDNKSFLKLTTQYYKLPAGRIIHRKPGDKVWGINPDLEVKMTTTQVADMIKYRQDVDVIRGDNDKPDPKVEVATAAKMLEKGMDPQLSAALLVLKTGLVAEHVAIAAKDEPAKNP